MDVFTAFFRADATPANTQMMGFCLAECLISE